MAIVQKTDPKGVDAVIDAIQQYLFTNLTGLGGGWASYECYPRANKNIKGTNIIPEISTDVKNYLEVLFDDTFNATSFFLVDDNVPFNNEERHVLQDIELIFQVNLPKLFPAITTRRADEDLHELILQLLIDNDELIVNTDGYTTGVDKVYSNLRLRDYSKNSIDLDDMSEFHVVKFRFTVTWDADDCATDFSPACNPVSVSVNTVPFAVYASGSAPNIEVRNVSNALVGFKDGLIWRVPDGGATISNTAQPSKTGANDLGSFATNDDAQTNRGAGVDYFTLNTNNGFGNPFKFTGITGGYWDHNTSQWKDKDGVVTTEALAIPSDVVINNATRNPTTGITLGLYRVGLPQGNQATQLAGQPYTFAGKNDWYVLNELEGSCYVYRGIFRDPFNYPPISHNMTASSNYIWSNYKDNAGGGYRWANSQFGVTGASILSMSFVVRYYTDAELGI